MIRSVTGAFAFATVVPMRASAGVGRGVIAALPVVVTAYRRGRGNYTKTPEFRALVGDYLI